MKYPILFSLFIIALTSLSCCKDNKSNLISESEDVGLENLNPEDIKRSVVASQKDTSFGSERKRLNKLKSEKIRKSVTDCGTEIEKKLCSENWYVKYGYASLFKKDTILLLKNEERITDFLKFQCRNHISFKKELKVTFSSWVLRRDTLQLKLEYEEKDYEEFETSYRDYQYLANLHTTFEIVQLDSLLRIVRIADQVNSYQEIMNVH